MTLTIQCLDIDAADPQALASFWEAALGWRRTHDTPTEVAPFFAGVGANVVLPERFAEELER